ncbi:selenoneine synthase SenA [Thiohalophilus thiocyanatoxydans]|uniref:Iron(II)-dependent oxidoreductase n=1 Tax=Thiohalophilus thiocyanatoxydans TaxID=381308 RepID=A0A4R8IUH4_9GAMM|nr:selenoneine synthase SenA [Thiohalophilus thiocyanatoxydans]TDY00953.1 iron(II)-dependent oxidoreductase [Thiohalophilus thiocyanatoxydans]
MYKLNPDQIAKQIEDAHQRSMALVDGLSSEQLMGPRLAIVNPLRWEIGHAAYFYEYWVLRQHLHRPPIREDADQLYDSISIAHDERWDLPLPTMRQTLEYIQTVKERVKACLANGEDAQRDYLAQYAVFHHDMHNEAYTYTRQTLDYPAPDIGKPGYRILDAGGLEGDVKIPGGEFMLGARPTDGFVFDNEKWAHPVELESFDIARAAVSNGDYLRFVEADGYNKREYWDEEGWEWRNKARLEHPVYWRLDADGWKIKQFDQWQPMPVNAALIHVCWHEAQAYCRWAGRRLPTEAEWEAAAAAEPSADGRTLSPVKRRFPWGDNPPRPDQANLDGYALGVVDVGAHAAGDSAFGCRQMMGNVWEWTQDTFMPFPGFEPDMYQDYSQPLFGITRVLRGGAWPTRGRLIRNTWRTYYGPERNDVFAGFRTCAER